MEFEDSFESTIIREIKEEFDFEIDIVDSLEVFNHLIPDEHQHWVALCFICKIKSGQPKIMEPDTCEAIGWFTLYEVKHMDLAIASQHRLKQMSEKYPYELPELYK